jgi:hypothetical protein
MKNNFISTLFLFISIFSLFYFLPVNAQPSAITDLDCVFSEMKGSVWLTWTPPAGAVRYDVRYALSPITASDYNFAYQFSQNWSGTQNQGLVTDLTEEKTWFFAMKAIDSEGRYSDISNVAYCYVPKWEEKKDKIAPVSQIDDPKDGATILAGKDYIIKGKATDTGGSSVQKVEISFDGKNWFLTKPKESIDSGFTFEYLWEKPKEGNYQIKTRATDWWENQEIPGEGINVKVVLELPMEKPVEKPISQMTAQELKTKIIETQLKLIELMKQLIQLLQQEISRIQR